MDLTKFKELGLSELTLEALRKKGFEEPTEIQAKVIPMLLDGDMNIIGQAQTGTGKTAAFALPLIERLPGGAKYPQAIILCPTRELALQVSEEIISLRGKSRVSILAVYGGQSIGQQISRLKRGVDIVVGTPGRVIDHINRKTLRLEEISYLILDEADEMLNMGFIDDIEKILKHTNEEKRILLFSATMPKVILSLAKKYMGEYEKVSVHAELTTDLTDQIYFEVRYSDKFEALCRIIDVEEDFYGLVFCRTKVDVDTVSSHLIDRGYDADGLHGDLSQNQRERTMGKFRNRRINILVATDVAARGLDINNLTHVINYSLPQDPESYVHRIGRTGRAGQQGTAITFITPSEYRKLVFIQRVAKTDIRKEKLPRVQDVISFKRNRLKDEIQAILEQENISAYLELAQEMMQDYSPHEVVAAIIKFSFEEELDESNYSEINEVRANSVNREGKTRLFVALGRKKGMTPKKLIQMVKEKVDISERLIRDIKIMEDFSFLNLPFAEAEMILNAFKKDNRGQRPIIEKAKDKKRRR